MTKTTQHQGLAELANAIATGATTSTAVVTEVLERIDASQPTLNAFRVVRRHHALAEAAEADRRIAAGERAPLLGVPIAVKDDTDIAGEVTAFGCGGEIAPAVQDSNQVRKLRAAGAVLVGKTNACELGQLPLTGAKAFGVTRNPWNRGHTPGGSSGGSAAAVAAGLLPAAMGTDGAGSVRIPAAWTNLVGIKPQRGRISTWPEAESFKGLTVIGPLARTVADAALLFDLTAGDNHPDERHRPPAVTVSDAVGRDPGRLRIALSLRIPFGGVPARLDPQVEARVRGIARTLEQLGHDVTVGDPAYDPTMSASMFTRSMTGIAEWYDRLPNPDVDPRTHANVRAGRLLNGLPLFAARRAEPVYAMLLAGIFRRFDVVLAPSTATPPPRADAIDGLGSFATNRVIVGAAPYTWPWNLVGWPAVAVPAGFTDAGLPVGAQLMGPANSERRLVSLAAQLESELQWQRHRPEPWWS